jgi:DnaJ-class molecular chaperone
MKKFQDFYTLFDITPNSDEKHIKLGYLNKISKFSNIKKISNENIREIKLLKTGLYILTNMELKNIYDNIIRKNSNRQPDTATLSEKNKDFSDNEPLPENHENNDTFDTVFKVDNSWMNQVNVNSETNNGRKNKGENNTISNRIFSLSEFNKKPNFSSDIDSELRRPLQGREDKSKLDQ